MEASIQTPFSLFQVISTMGTVAVFGGFIYVGRKLQILDNLQVTMEKMKNNVKVIGDSLIQSNLTDFDGSRLQTYSPVRVTEKGISYLQEIGFLNVFSSHKNDFFNTISSETPQTNYDIELASIRSIYLMFDKSYFNEIKDYLYNHPKENKNELIKIAGIYVRDKYIESLGLKK